MVGIGNLRTDALQRHLRFGSAAGTPPDGLVFNSPTLKLREFPDDDFRNSFLVLALLAALLL